MIYKCNSQLFEMENIQYNTCAKHYFQKTTTLIVQSTAALCLATMNWNMLGWCFPTTFGKLGIPSLNIVVCSFVSFCVDIPHVHGDF